MPVCKFCGKKLEKGECYIVTTFAKEKIKYAYYCSKEEYDTAVAEKEKRKLMMSYIDSSCAECMEQEKIMSTVFYKEKKEWIDAYSIDIVFSYFKVNKDKILYSMHQRVFNNEFSKIRYLSAIVKNNLDDFAKQYMAAAKPVIVKTVDTDTTKMEIAPKTFNNIKGRRSLSDLEEEYE